MFDFCGIGNACVDIVARTEDSFLREWGFAKGICTYIDVETAARLDSALAAPSRIPGGCAANVASCITALGGTAAFIGRVAGDDTGTLFIRDLKTRNVHYAAQPVQGEGVGSTRIFVLVTPDTQRSFAAYYGVQEDLSEADIDVGAVQDSRFLYLDGYALNSKNGAQAFLAAARMAHAAGKTIILAPSDISILRKFGPALEALIPFADILFCNDAEARHMTGEQDIDRAIAALRARFARGAVTTGEDGSWVFDEAGMRHIPAAMPPGPVTDTNGAGDNFAGGCLYGLARGFPLERAARLGNLCAAAIITVAGPRPLTDQKHILDQITE